MNKFDLKLVKHLDISSETTENGRFYSVTEGVKYPSVTTVLSSMKDDSWLKKWEEAVGADYAKTYTAVAARRGTNLHTLCEEYIKGNPDYLKGHMPFNIALFKQVQKILDTSLTEVYGSEIALYSNHLKVAGRCDLIGKFNGKRSIIDFKTTNYWKDMDRLSGYFIQEATYMMMFMEMYGLEIEQLVTISAAESEPCAQVVIIDDPWVWCKRAVKLIKNYYVQNSK